MAVGFTYCKNIVGVISRKARKSESPKEKELLLTKNIPIGLMRT